MRLFDVARRKRSDEDDLAWLIQREIPRLRRYASILAGGAERGDQLVGDCLDRAARRGHRWERDGSIRVWLYRTLSCLFTDRHAAGAGAGDDPLHDDRKLACLDIAQAMELLPRTQRAALGLTAVEGFSHDEAARILGVPVSILRARVSSGRERLRRIYAQPASRYRLRGTK